MISFNFIYTLMQNSGIYKIPSEKELDTKLLDEK